MGGMRLNQTTMVLVTAATVAELKVRLEIVFLLPRNLPACVGGGTK